MTDQPKLEDFPARSYDKLRYGDTDRQGHINNVAFAVFLETGRVEMFEGSSWREGSGSFVIARLELDYLGEIFWPGTVEVGSCLRKFGRSSFAVSQALFQAGRLVAKAESVLVWVDAATHRPTPLPDDIRAHLGKWSCPALAG